MLSNKYHSMRRENLLFTVESCARRLTEEMQNQDTKETPILCERQILYLLLSVKKCLYHGLKSSAGFDLFVCWCENRKKVDRKQTRLMGCASILPNSTAEVNVRIDRNYTKFASINKVGIFVAPATIQFPDYRDYDDAKLMSWILDGMMKKEICKHLKWVLSKKLKFQ